MKTISQKKQGQTATTKINRKTGTEQVSQSGQRHCQDASKVTVQELWSHGNDGSPTPWAVTYKWRHFDGFPSCQV